MPETPILQLSRGNVTIGQSAAEAREQSGFAEKDFVLLPNFLANDLQSLVSLLCRSAHFIPRETPGLGTMEVEELRRAGHTLSMALSQPALLAWISEFAGCPTLVRADGRVHRSRFGTGHGLDWHDDIREPERQLAITIDLSEHSYDGGTFEMRDARSHQLLCVHQHKHRGTALMFRVSRRYEHRVLPVTNGGPRLVYSGWFYTA